MNLLEMQIKFSKKKMKIAMKFFAYYNKPNQ